MEFVETFRLFQVEQNIRNFTRRPTCISDGCFHNKDRFCTVRCEMTPKKQMTVQRSRLLWDKYRKDCTSPDGSTKKLHPGFYQIEER